MTALHETSLEGLTGKKAKLSFKNSTESVKGTISKKKGKFYITPNGKIAKTPIELDSLLQVQRLN